MLAPMLAMVCLTADEEPWPISIMAMTADTPMTMPKVVRAERMMLRRRAFKAIFSVRLNFLMGALSLERERRRSRSIRRECESFVWHGRLRRDHGSPGQW